MDVIQERERALIKRMQAVRATMHHRCGDHVLIGPKPRRVNAQQRRRFKRLNVAVRGLEQASDAAIEEVLRYLENE